MPATPVPFVSGDSTAAVAVIEVAHGFARPVVNRVEGSALSTAARHRVVHNDARLAMAGRLSYGPAVPATGGSVHRRRG